MWHISSLVFIGDIFPEQIRDDNITEQQRKIKNFIELKLDCNYTIIYSKGRIKKSEYRE